MYKVFAALFVLLAALSCQAQISLPIGGSSSGDDSNRKSARVTSRILSGTVTDKANDKPIPEAVVYLKNTKSLQIRSFFTQKDGTYYFHDLSPDIDYELKAEFSGASSSAHTLSSFDSRKVATINLKLNPRK